MWVDIITDDNQHISQVDVIDGNAPRIIWVDGIKYFFENGEYVTNELQYM